MGEIQYHQAYCTCHTHSGNAVVGDMFMSCRPKVYCLLQILHKKQVESAKVCNEFYRGFENGKSVEDQVSLWRKSIRLLKVLLFVGYFNFGGKLPGTKARRRMERNTARVQ